MALVSNLSRKTWFWTMLTRSGGISVRQITTSEKKKESNEACSSPDTVYRKVPDFSKPEESKNWISFGFDFQNEVRDKYKFHFTQFCFFTIVVCGWTFYLTYFPDRKERNWAKREAFIRLHEREQLGLDPVDPNYVDPSKIVLPPDEELSDDDIII